MASTYGFACVILFLGYTAISSSDDIKRILVGDQPVEHSLQEQLQTTKLQVLELTTKVTAQEKAIASHNSEITQLKARLNEIQGPVVSNTSLIANLTGSTYVRWGNKTCPGNGTKSVYTGFGGGSDYTYTGGPGDFLCMPPEPLYEKNATTQGSVYVNGVQYESNFYGTVEVDDAMPCVLCHTNRSSVIMLPGRNRCYDGWTLEYHGWLAAGGYNQASSQYICLDRYPVSLKYNMTYWDGRVLFAVVSECGSLPCPPYHSGVSLSCAVCSI